MTTFKSPDLMTKNRHMGAYGNGTISWGSVSPIAGGNGDVYYITIIPGGTELTGLRIVNDDLDTGSGMSGTIGYMPVNAADGPVAVPDYFSATGTFLTAAGMKECVFYPIKFEFPVIVTITLTAAATGFATGKVTAIATGIAAGRK